MKKFRKLSILFALTAFAFFATSCRNDDDSNDGPTNAYPKQVKITYVVTSPQPTTLQLISYKNETNGMTNVSNPALPYTKSITRTVNRNDDASLGFGGAPDSNVKLEILVNDQLAKTQTFTNTGTGALVYLFP